MVSATHSAYLMLRNRRTRCTRLRTHEIKTFHTFQLSFTAIVFFFFLFFNLILTLSHLYRAIHLVRLQPELFLAGQNRTGLRNMRDEKLKNPVRRIYKQQGTTSSRLDDSALQDSVLN